MIGLRLFLSDSSRAQRATARFLRPLLLASFAVRCERIHENVPYPRHVDEETFLKNSMGMLRERTARPMSMNWPSFPLYLAAAAHTSGEHYALH